MTLLCCYFAGLVLSIGNHCCKFLTGQDGGDIWRDSALRYAGYANEVGESFRNIAPRLVVPSCESVMVMSPSLEFVAAGVFGTVV